MGLSAREQDPGSARFNAIAVAVLLSLIGCIVGFVSAGLLFDSSLMARWILGLLGASVGSVPLMQWRRDQRSSEHVDLYGVDPQLRPVLRRAVDTTERISRAAATSPPGPVADVLDENHRSALAHVRLLAIDARQAGSTYRSELLRQCHQLDELARTSESLLHAALEAQPTVLNALTERTELIRRALTESDPERGLSATSDERDLEDRDATNDR